MRVYFYSGQSTQCWFETLLDNSLFFIYEFVFANVTLTDPRLQWHDRAKQI